MPSLPTVSRRRQRSEEDTDAASPTPTQSSTGSKRRRLQSPVEHDDDNDGNDTGDEGADQETDTGEGGPKPSTQASMSMNGTQATQTQATQLNGSQAQSEPDANGYKPGSIVRIKVNDFVTYTSAEFFPGPKLNMVIGPNGTGKSTLVCAICLGLGWGPQHLGRAKDPGEFVKHGCREASIEIELAGGTRFRRNPVVRRVIKRDGNKSFFFLNDKPVGRNKVYELAQSFAIQIDNLCQFLPQDKVAEFAALTPIELLHSTQRAAAGPEMLEWHESLKKLRAQQKKLQTDNQADKDLLANLENRQEMQRADVERMRQRAEIKRKIEMMEFSRPVTQYKDHHQRYEAAKENTSKLRQELQQLEAELEPAFRVLNAKRDYCTSLNDAVKEQEKLIDQASNSAKELAKKIEQREDSIKDLAGQIEAERKSAATHKQEQNRIHQTVNKLKRQMEEEPVEFNVDWYNERIREKRQEMRNLMARGESIKDERRPIFEALNDRKMRIHQAERQLSNLDSVSGRQETKLETLSHDTYTAYKWLLDNQDKFEKEVFAPPIVSCSVKDPKYADALESLMQKNDYLAFTTQSRNDFRTLQKYLSIDMKLSDISIKTSSVPLDRFQPSLSDGEIRQFGFDGWAKDYLNGPDPVIAVLCSENRLHQTPIGLRDINDDEYNRIAEGTITSWVSGKHSYQISRRREYGPSATSTRTRQVRRAQAWTTQPVEASTKHELQQRVQVLRDELREFEEKANAGRARLEQLGREHGDIKREMEELEREKSDRQTAHTNFRAIPEKISQQEAKLKSMESISEGVKARVRGIRDQQDRLSIKKAEATIEYARAVEKLRKLHEQHITTRVRQIEAISDFDTLEHRSEEQRTIQKQKEAEVTEAMAYLKSASEIGKKLMKEASAIVKASKRQPDLEEFLKTLSDYTSERLEADIDSEKARLELTQGGSNNVIKEFEERERQINKLRSKLADFESQLSDFNYAINEVRSKWEPKLDALVKKISDAFSDSFARIGCAGQVALDKAGEEPTPIDAANGERPIGTAGDSDFDQWSIQIHVKFRESEGLSLLDSHRQSGGERAVSTIFYLMALQSLSASPFRVVDEINQGMDPRNERMVHERLVDIACAHTTTANSTTASNDDESVGGGGGGQYFLITPKLLSGLVYKPGMRVLCIVSGEHMPPDYSQLNFGHVVERLRAVKTAHGANAKGKGRAIKSPVQRVNGVSA
ncbi:DNA repair ATPase SMC5 [Aspergillus chevalieri]|uniref:Structural maintenance of chromosomes protein 5 n=1 Tax=Aspergillus chevalieri TaxID=182096 RepID=A0A7R7VS09_ASPCH|nr:structural maintenance of chromosomes protein 5 [Aspergillus chevalieri]BCR89662.1 structural maintenance of chromosomes protein 5 [Aspergillus chevalieri]